MKKLLLFLLTFSLVAILHAATAYVDGITWTYQVLNGEASITECPTSTSGAITIPATLGGYPVTSIGGDAFWGCSRLTSVTIPEGVTSIGERAFYGCSRLTSVTIPEGVTSIGWSAFSGCSRLASVTIPSSVTTIGSSAFNGCSNLTSFVVDSANQHYTVMNKLLCSKDGKTLIACPSGLTSVTIPEGVTTISKNAFYNCSSLTSVTIPSTVKSIGDSAFSGCSSLTSITIPEGVTTIGTSAFSGCSNLWKDTNGVQYESAAKVVLIDVPTSLGGEFIIPNSVRFIHSNAFNACSGLTSVTLPSSVTSIGSSAFYNCSSLTSVTLPSSVTSIGSLAFSGCSSLTSVTIPEGVTSIGSEAFSGCSNLWKDTNGVQYESAAKVVLIDVPTSLGGEFIIPNSVRFIHSNAFNACSGLTSVTLPSSVTSIGISAFNGCSSLTSITLPSSVTTIELQAFYNCSSLTSVTIPSSVTSIGISAFNGCSSLTSVTIPEGVTTIGEKAFLGCSSLTSVTIPEGVTSIGERAFEGCSGLTSVTIPKGVTSIGDYAFLGCSGLTSVTIPEGVTFIGGGAFDGCSSLTSVTIPKGVTFIGEGAFSYCSSLTSVTIPEGCTFIGGGAFSYCSSLTSVTILEGVTSIGDHMFYYCSNLTSVKIPESVTFIGDSAFSWCDSLTSMYFKGEPPSVDFYALSYVPGTVTIYYLPDYASEWVTCDWWEGWTIKEWVEGQYSLVFDANGGDGGGMLTQMYETPVISPVVTREGYTFVGWFPEVPATVPAMNTTYTAQWQINQYTITFDAAGGEGGTSVTQDYGSSLIAPTVTREGYRFVGWSPEVPTTVPAANATYTAQWQINQYTITFDAAGGEGGTVVTQDYATPLVVPSVTREYYTFLGWSPAVPTTVPAKDMVYTAQWKAYQYMQTFDANGGEGGVSLILDYGSTITPPTITREGYVLIGWKPELPKVVPPKSETYVAQWRREGEMDDAGDNPTVHTPPSWSVSNYQNNMVVYAQVKDITTGAFIESAGSLLGAFDANGLCRGVIGLLDIGLEHPVYQLTVCSDETSGEVLTLKVWDAATGEITELSDKVTFVSDTEIGLLWEPVVYEIGLKALSMTLNPGWNWCSINVAMPEGTALSEFFTDWTPQNGDQVKAGTQTATYFNGAWRPTDFVMRPGMMYLIKNGTDAAVTTTVMGTPANMDETIDIATGWNWVGYTGAEPIAAANAFVDNSMFANGDVLKSNAASATFYNGAWRGVLTLTPGVGYKLKVASGATIQYAQPAATASLMAAPFAMMASAEAPDWKVSNYQYNMVVYASIQNAQGVSLEADGNLLAAFDANGVCRGVIDPLDIGIGVKVYQLTVCSDEATESGLTLKLWDAATSTIYDVNGTIDFKSDTEIGLLWEPQVYTVVETEAKYAVTATVVGNGSVTGAGDYAVGEQVTLTATADNGAIFLGWSDGTTNETLSFTMSEADKTVTATFVDAAVVNAYIVANNLMSKDEAKQELLDADEVFTADEMKALALGAPVIQVKNGKAIVSIQVQRASELDGEWEVVEDGEVSVEITPKAGEKVGFYKFVVPNEQ